MTTAVVEAEAEAMAVVEVFFFSEDFFFRQAGFLLGLLLFFLFVLL